MKIKKINSNIINTIILSVFVSLNALCQLFKGINNIIVYMVAIELIILFLNNKKNIFKLLKKQYIFIAITLSLFILSFIFNGKNDSLIYYFLCFILYGISAFLIVNFNTKLEQKLFFKTNTIICIIVTFKLLIIDKVCYISHFKSIDWGMLMGITYSILPGIISEFICLFDKENTKRFRIISFIALLISIYVYFSIGSRGAILAFMIFIYMYILRKIYINVKNIKKRRIIIYSILGITLLAILNINNILLLTSSLLKKLNVNTLMVNKIYRISENNDLLNGRDNVYSMAFADIKNTKKYIFGSGIASYENLHNIGYVHNLFLQMFYEGGIVYLSLMLYILVPFLIKSLNFKNRYFTFDLFLICISLIELSFSSFFWGSQKFWLLIAYILSNYKMLKDTSNYTISKEKKD